MTTGDGAGARLPPVAVVEVLLATYNGAGYLAAQLDSILAQTGVELRVLARDDGSRDGTAQILADYAARHPGRLRILPALERLGACGSFLALLAASSAGYVAFADQDDIWLPEKLSVLLRDVQAVEARRGADWPVLAHCDLEVVDSELRQIAPSYWRHAGLDPSRNRLPQLMFQNTATGCAMLCNRALVKLALPGVPGIPIHDHWLALHAAVFGEIVIEPRALVRYRQHAHNVVGAKLSRHRELLRQTRLNLAGGHWRRDWAPLLAMPAAFYAANRARLPAEAARLLEGCLSIPQRGYWSRVFMLFQRGLGPGSMLRRIIFRLRA